MQRFKVKSLQKLLIHINFLLAFSVLFCSHSAFGQPSVRVDIDSRAIDMGMGLNVYWADRNVGANGSLDAGTYFAWGEVESKNNYSWNTYIHRKNGLISKYTYYSGPFTLLAEDDAATHEWGNYWRIPTKQEFENLKANANFTIGKYGSTFDYDIKFVNRNDPTKLILLPCAGYMEDNQHKNSFGTIKEGYGYYWSSTLYTILTSLDAYALSIFPKTIIYSDKVSMEYDRRDYGYPIRPVIDKCSSVNIVATYDGQTTTIYSNHSFPIGSLIITEDDDCYDHKCYEVIGDSVRNEVSDSVLKSNVTYEVVFTKKNTNVKAKTEDNQKGTVGLSIGTDNN